MLIQPQSSADLFVSGAPTTQIVRGLVTPAGEDADNARQAVIIFPENTRFTNYAVPDGKPLEVQITEYTRGPQGVQRMPGGLPPTVGYTYAFELGFPAATAAGVRDVKFDRDVAVYVENFTHYPVGETVPLGYYDHEKGAWLAEKSGRILKILSTTGGEATVDVTGDGVADTGTALSALGITTSELQALATQYVAGTELWRVTVRHFSPWDCNWGFGPPEGAAPPPPPGPSADDLRGTPLYTFGYDPASGQVTSIRDATATRRTSSVRGEQSPLLLHTARSRRSRSTRMVISRASRARRQQRSRSSRMRRPVS